MRTHTQSTLSNLASVHLMQTQNVERKTIINQFHSSNLISKSSNPRVPICVTTLEGFTVCMLFLSQKVTFQDQFLFTKYTGLTLWDEKVKYCYLYNGTFFCLFSHDVRLCAWAPKFLLCRGQATVSHYVAHT